MLDVGLSPGVLDLWQQELLLDYTLEVEGREFKVHKVILASVSDYFKAMLGGSMRESTTDRVVLKGLSAHGVSKTIDVIYTGDEEIVAVHAAEILKCAVYFQIPKLVEACTDRLLHDINQENCFQLLKKLAMFSLQEAIQKVIKFMMHNWTAVSKGVPPKELSLELVQVILDLWKRSEWQLFQFIATWVEADYENRKVHINDLMSEVRFCLIDQEHLASITQGNIYTKSDGSWCQLVDKAADYHKLPMCQKVLVVSKQNEVRSDPRPLIIPVENTSAVILDKEGEDWEEIENLEVCPPLVYVPAVIEVNNFLIINAVPQHDEDNPYWYIFDPRTVDWCQIASPENKNAFGLVYRDEHLYVLGGSLPNDYDEDDDDFNALSDDVVEYSFKTNRWRTINKMPAPVEGHGACVSDDHIYVSGGERKVAGSLRSATSNMDCLDILTSTWHKKAPMSHAREGHRMGVITLHSEEVILILDGQLSMEYYTPGSDQWSVFKHSFSSEVLMPPQYGLEGAVRFKGNSVFFLHIFGNYVQSGHQYKRANVRWDFSDDEIEEVHFPHYGPLEDGRLLSFGVLVSIDQ